MQSIKILTSYFGPFNNYFPLWKASVEKNPTIDFTLITDQTVENPPSNMRVRNMSFAEMQKRVRDFFKPLDFEPVIDNGYKMSEYQVLFALIFPEIVGDSDFWGYCETDLILGDLRRFFTEEILSQHDKIYFLGHLTLYRNSDAVNRLPLLEHEYPVATWRQAFSTPYNYHFIEDAMRWIPKYAGLKCYYEIEFGDISFNHYRFIMARGRESRAAPQVYRWNDGRLSRIYLWGGVEHEEECSYVHLQKRKMEIHVNAECVSRYLIVPNEFIGDRQVSKDDLRRWAKDSYRHHIWLFKFWTRYYLKTLSQGGLFIKRDKLVRKLKYGAKVRNIT